MSALEVLKFLSSEDGPTTTEYAVMLALIIAVLITAINAVGNSTSGAWANNVNQIGAATATAS